MKNRLLLFGLNIFWILICGMNWSAAQVSPAIQWQNTIGGSSAEYFSSIRQTTDGGYICGGWSESDSSGDKTENSQGFEDYWVVKIDSTGIIEWQNSIGGNGFDELNSILQTADGGYICGGVSNSLISGDKTEDSYQASDDYWVVKLDALGAIEWQNTIGGDETDNLTSIQQTIDGGYICGGWSDSPISGDKTENALGGNDYWVVKLDASGAIEWQNSIGGSGNEYLYAIQQTEDGGYFCGGYSNSPVSGDKTEASRGLFDYWVVKMDTLGTIEWEKTVGGSGSDFLAAIQQTSDNGFIFGGRSDSPISGDKTEMNQGLTDFWIVKLDVSGSIQWQNTIGGSDADGLFSIQQTADEEYICGGFSKSPISGDKTEINIGESDFWILKLDSAGTVQWQNTIGGTDSDNLYSLQQTADGGYVCGGMSRSPISGDKTENSQGDFDYWVVKLYPDTTTAIEFIESDFPSIKIGPNPASEWFMVYVNDATGFGPSVVEIRDLTGRLVNARGISGKEIVVFNVRDYADGTYSLRVVFDNGYSIVRLIQLLK